MKTVIELNGEMAGFGGNGGDEVHAEKVPEMSSQEAKAGRSKIVNAIGRIWKKKNGQLSQVELSYFP